VWREFHKVYGRWGFRLDRPEGRELLAGLIEELKFVALNRIMRERPYVSASISRAERESLAREFAQELEEAGWALQIPKR
jgi:hypothetical protein